MTARRRAAIALAVGCLAGGAGGQAAAQTIAPQGMRLAGQLFATEPTTLYLGARETAVLRPLRQRGEQCTASAAVTIGNGENGSLWVSSVR